MAAEVSTCVEALMNPGWCCSEECFGRAEIAVLTSDLTEHAMCLRCADQSDAMAEKPLQWDPKWSPTE